MIILGSLLPFLAVIPQSRTNRRRNEPCEFAYAESPMNYNVSINQEITDSRLHTALRSVSLVQSGFRNDFF